MRLHEKPRDQLIRLSLLEHDYNSTIIGLVNSTLNYYGCTYGRCRIDFPGDVCIERRGEHCTTDQRPLFILNEHVCIHRTTAAKKIKFQERFPVHPVYESATVIDILFNDDNSKLK